ncbi:alcohol dehydrogenase catalytic domain-containing protein [Spiroplasma endosymbiont of Megaselia nigra]|uniref:alcohol dehydrogenase catalytic domain-containing protein n=1 Tax=Spiroplasma endosymbiont of Megaselia nigra TaxID=2478537 RepID=UPI001F4E8D1B|nr:alcohol dehydrogenase catalytic domain-containing protein [Spiroplasma endosymbiont of Megaselia nigra]
MGHEGVGVVTAIGADITKLKIGDRVAIGCVTHCNICQLCEQKAFANCTNGGFILGTKINGTHAEYVRVPYGENSVIKIPKTMNLTDALMLSDVLPTGYENVIKKINLKQINNIAIIGDGPIGLDILLLLNKYNKKIDIYGHHSQKLNYFKKMGAHKIYDSTLTTFDIKYDLVIECVGNDQGTFEQAQQRLILMVQLLQLVFLKNQLSLTYNNYEIKILLFIPEF